MEYVIGLTGLAAAGALMSKDKKSQEDRRTFAMNQEKNNQVVRILYKIKLLILKNLITMI